jgi:hypothetical protein
MAKVSKTRSFIATVLRARRKIPSYPANCLQIRG